MLVDDQIPITAAPKDAKTSASPPAPAWNMKKATVEKKSGQRTFEEPVERRARHHLQVEREAAHEDAGEAGARRTSAVVGGRVASASASAATGCSVTSATYASSSVGSRVVTRPSETPCSRSRIAWVGSWPSAAWTTTTCA